MGEAQLGPEPEIEGFADDVRSLLAGDGWEVVLSSSSTFDGMVDLVPTHPLVPDAMTISAPEVDLVQFATAELAEWPEIGIVHEAPRGTKNADLLRGLRSISSDPTIDAPVDAVISAVHLLSELGYVTTMESGLSPFTWWGLGPPRGEPPA